MEHVCRNGIRIDLGNGETTLLWEDVWVGNSTLKSKFPRLYYVSLHKHMKIKDCGLWNGLAWCWNLLWRRELFDWENELVT